METLAETLEAVGDANDHGVVTGESLATRLDISKKAAGERLWRLWPDYVTWIGDTKEPRFAITQLGRARLTSNQSTSPEGET